MRARSAWPPEGRPPGVPVADQSVRNPLHRALCVRLLGELRQCDPATLADVVVDHLEPDERRALERQLAEVLHRVRVSLDSPEGALGQELGTLLVELGRLPVPARERVGDAMLRVLPLLEAPEILSSTLDVLSDVGMAACEATEAAAGVDTADLAARLP